jgi:hypothetical protein
MTHAQASRLVWSACVVAAVAITAAVATPLLNMAARIIL